MTRRALALALLAAAAPACGGKKAAHKAPPAAPFDTRVAVRDDCLHHAVAAAAVPEAYLVASACAHAEEDEGEEEILTVRIDASGVASANEPVQILSTGWATNVLIAPIAGSGALLAWTAARDRKGFAAVAAVDVQGRPVGPAVELGEGRAMAMTSGPQGAALAIVNQPDAISDADAVAALDLSLVVLDVNGKPVARVPISAHADAVVQLAVSAAPGGYAIAWLEGGVLVAARVDSSGALGARGPIVPEADALHLPAGAIFRWPALTVDAKGKARVAALVTLPGERSAELWLGEGDIGMASAGWHWHRLAGLGAGRRSSLSLVALAGGGLQLAWVEAAEGREFPAIQWLRVNADGAAIGAPAIAIDQVAHFDGPIALASGSNAALVAGAVPPGNDATSALEVVQQVQ